MQPFSTVPFLFFWFTGVFTGVSLNHPPAQADELEHIPPVQFSGRASFETLRDDTFTPAESLPFDQSRASTYDSLKYQTNFSGTNYGYPSGQLGLNFGGRSSTDTQVSTLGVPFNLAQGGGADLSFFPGYLWKEAKLLPTVTSAAFAPGAASASLELLPWTRETLLDSKLKNTSRFTASYDRMVQTFSAAAKTDRVAALAGMSTGLERGPAFELSYFLIDQSEHKLLFHTLASSQEGDVMGSKFQLTPKQVKQSSRVIPVLESHQDLGQQVSLESTLFGDLSHLQVIDHDPANAPYYNSNTFTEQYGIENALVFGPSVFAFSGRYVLLSGTGAFGRLHEWPLFAGFTREFFLNDDTSLKASVNATYTEHTGVYPGGKLSAKFSQSEHSYPYVETNAIAKMPTLVDRFGVYPNPYGGLPYVGNPNLKPERVFNAIAGYVLDEGALRSDTSVKVERRHHTQIGGSTMVENQGNASLILAEEALHYRLSRAIQFGSRTTLTDSSLQDSGSTYAYIPWFSEGLTFEWDPSSQLKLVTLAKLMGESETSSFTENKVAPLHQAYTLFDQSISARLSPELTLSGGVDNIFNNLVDVVQGYTLPGRIFYLSAQASF